MKPKHLHCKIKRTPEEAARLRADRERYQRERPTPQQLLAEADMPNSSSSANCYCCIRPWLGSSKNESGRS